MRVGSLFSGIGGFDLGLERCGMEIVWQVENEPYCRKVLAKHWPNVPCYEDIHDVGAHNLEEVDVICGGFPCQPVSTAGKQRGQDDERWLWPEFARILRELRPRYALVENVPGLLVRGMGDVLRDLAAAGYDAEWGCISAASVGAPHLRKRIFVIAHTDSGELRDEPRGWNGSSGSGASVVGHDGEEGVVAHTDSGGREVFGVAQPRRIEGARRGVTDGCSEDGRLKYTTGREHWAVESSLGRVAHGVSHRVDRLRALGNAIVPQVAEWIGRRLPSEEG
jgi:DNA (cytosine-5)-methyltransferase 1